ncbi:MAG TPA: DUF3617 family protein [Methylophilaceae bacterium]|nr:DUF3617 family protein [Methylophilaceae bacterium]
MHLTKRLVLLGVLSFAISVKAAEPRPGLWNLSVTTTAEGSDGVFGPYTSSQCLTEEDVRNPEKLLAQNGANACTYGDKVYSGGNFSFTVQCGGTIPMSGSGRINYTADSLQGTMDIAADLQGLPVNTHSTVSGQRVGDCTK